MPPPHMAGFMGNLPAVPMRWLYCCAAVTA